MQGLTLNKRAMKAGTKLSPVVTPSQERPDFDAARSTDYAIIRAEIIKELKTKIREGKRGIIYRDEPLIKDTFRGKKSSVSEDEFIERLRKLEGSSDQVIRATDSFYTFVDFYPVHNRQQLLKYLLEKGEIGLKDNYKLWICYEGIKEDIAALISEGWIRVVSYEDKKPKKAELDDKKKKVPAEAPKRMFFPKDIRDPDVEYTRQQLPDNCHRFLANLWDKKVGDIKWEQIL